MSTESRVCPKCRQSKPLEEFPVRTVRGVTSLHGWCASCKAAYDHAYQKLHPRKFRKNTIPPRERERRLRNEVIDAYGARCRCCGETAREFLTIEHIGRTGAVHRANRSQYGIYNDIKQAGFPKDKYEVLCMNCNWATRLGDPCPHELARERLVA